MPKYRAKNRNRVRPKTHDRPGGYRARPEAPREKMSLEEAEELANSMDLPDGAFFAMVGELMGGDYMTAIDAMAERHFGEE